MPHIGANDLKTKGIAAIEATLSESPEANPFHPSLRAHALGGKLEGLHSVSINLSYRIMLELLYLRSGERSP